MKKPLEIICYTFYCRAKVCEERGHKFSERKLKEREGIIFVEYKCSRCGRAYQETPTATEMEKYHKDTKELFV